MTPSNAPKSSAPPCAGSAQTSSSRKSGAISAIRQRRDSCSLFGSLMPIMDCRLDLVEERLDHAVVARLDPLAPDLFVLSERLTVDRVAGRVRVTGLAREASRLVSCSGTDNSHSCGR